MNERQPNKRGLYAPCADTPGVHLIEWKRKDETFHDFNVKHAQDAEKEKLNEGERIYKDESGLNFKVCYNRYDGSILETYCGWLDNGKKYVQRFRFKMRDGKVANWQEIELTKGKTIKKAYHKLIYGS